MMQLRRERQFFGKCGRMLRNVYTPTPYTKCINSCASIASGILATDLCLSWPKVLNLVTVRASLKTPV